MGDAEVTEFDFSSRSEKPFLVRPEGETRGLLLYLHWFDEAPNANRTQFLEEARTMAGVRFISLLPQLEFPWKSPPTGLPADPEKIRAESDYLTGLVNSARSQFEIDRLGIVGHDFGAMHGTLVADELSSLCNVFIAPTPRWSDWFLRFWPIEDDRYDYMRAMEPLDPLTAVHGIEAPTLYQFARSDFYIASMTGLELFGAANEPKTMVPYEADHSLVNEQARVDRIGFLREHLGI
jgi:pimeloyl-ACP methyl ester carboxylesterase